MALNVALGKLIVKSPDGITDSVKVLKLEAWLNGEIASQAFEKYGLGIRVHIQEVTGGPKDGEQHIQSLEA